jgi:hypothetical protein
MSSNIQVPTPSPGEVITSPPQSFWIWIFLRIIIPTLPLLVQYSLHWLGNYRNPDFPQPAYITMIFSLSLSTLTEYRSLKHIIYGCIVPAGIGCIFYISLLGHEKDALAYKPEIAGFWLWSGLLIVNVIRVVTVGVKKTLGSRSTAPTGASGAPTI